MSYVFKGEDDFLPEELRHPRNMRLSKSELAAIRERDANTEFTFDGDKTVMEFTGTDHKAEPFWAATDRRALLAHIDGMTEALTEIADWDAHNEDCATIDSLTGRITDKDCSCGWVEVADVAREALGLPQAGWGE